MSVLYVDNSYSFGGAINSLSHLVGAFGPEGVEPIVSSGQSDEMLSQLFPGAARYHRTILSPWRPGTVYRRLKRLPGLRKGPGQRLLAAARGGWRVLTHHVPQGMTLARIGARHKVDLVHINNAIEGQPDALVASRLLGVPAVAHARGPQNSSRASRLYASGVERHIAISTYIADNLRGLGVPEDHIEMIPDGIDLDTFHPAPASAALLEELGIPRGSRVFGIFGRVIRWKGIAEFVEAAVRLIADLPDAVALVVGDPSDGGKTYYKRVREAAARSDASDRIIFTGYRSDVPDLMRLCDVVVHTSIDPEPFGMVLAEAMACGIPVVASDLGGPRDIVTAGTGFLVDPRDAAAVAHHIRLLLEDPELRRKMGQEALERARREYSARVYAERVLAVYDSVLSDDIPRPRVRR